MIGCRTCSCGSRGANARQSSEVIAANTTGRTRLVVAGVCMQPDAVHPFFGIAKEINVQFVFGYDPEEFASSLRSIADGEVDVTPMITGEVGLDAVGGAFDELSDPDRHCKILVVPDL